MFVASVDGMDNTWKLQISHRTPPLLAAVLLSVVLAVVVPFPMPMMVASKLLNTTTDSGPTRHKRREDH